MNTDVTRREFLATVAAAQGAFVLGFWMPGKAHAQTQTEKLPSTPPGAAWYEEPATPEVNAWIVVAPDDTVTIRIAQTELGQGVWTSNAMMVCEELQCDWTKVRPQYASANRDAREKAPAWTLEVPGNGATDPTGGGVPTFGTRDRTGVAGIPDSLYRRMRTNAASSVKDGRYYLQLAGAEAASAPRDDHHQAAGSVDAHGNGAEEPRRAAQGDGTDRVRHRRPPAEHEVGGREGVSGLWRRRQALRFRRRPPDAGRAVRRAVPDSRPSVDPRPDLQRRRRHRRRQLVSGQVRHRSDADRVGRSARARGGQHGDDARCAVGRHRSAGPGPCEAGGRGRRLRARREDRGGDLLDAVSRPGAHGARQRHGAGDQRPRGHLDRRSEPPGNALQRLQDHRHPRAERLHPPVPPRWRLRPQRQRPPGRAGDHDRQRAPRHADPYAVDARAGLHRNDIPRDGDGAAEGRSRCRGVANRAGRAHLHAARRIRTRGVVRRDLALPRAELPLLEPHHQVSP